MEKQEIKRHFYTHCYRWTRRVLIAQGFLFSATFILGELIPFSTIVGLSAACGAVLAGISLGLLTLSGLLKLLHTFILKDASKETQEINENIILNQGPISRFCYKWCPRMLILTGVLGILFYIGLFYISQGVSEDTTLFKALDLLLPVSLVIIIIRSTLPFTILTLLLKLFHARI